MRVRYGPIAVVVLAVGAALAGAGGTYAALHTTSSGAAIDVVSTMPMPPAYTCLHTVNGGRLPCLLDRTPMRLQPAAMGVLRRDLYAGSTYWTTVPESEYYVEWKDGVLRLLAAPCTGRATSCRSAAAGRPPFTLRYWATELGGR